MHHMTSRERVLAVYQGTEPDRVPIDLQGLVVAREKLGDSASEMAADPEKIGDVFIASWEMVRSDVLTYGLLSLSMAMAAGNECDLNEQGTLFTKRYALEEKSVLAKISIPDPDKDFPLPSIISVCKRMSSTLGSEVAVRGLVSLPWTILVQMRGMEKLIFDTVDDPDFVHDAMRFCTDYTKIAGTALLNAMGEDSIGIYATDPSSGCSVISPKLYTEFVKPYHKEVVDHFHELNTTVTFHICGYLDPIMKEMGSLGIDGMSIDEKSSLDKMMEVSQGKTVVIGNVAPLLFANGTEKEIEDAVAKCMKTVANRKNYILASGCAVPPQTPLDNITAFMKAAEKYGTGN